jgi:predicted nuclease of restriction endonuclease-like (RecB) superfamily
MEFLPTNYLDVLSGLSTSIRETRLRAVVSVNTHLLQLYWKIGHIILTEQEKLGWGSGVIDQLSKDLKAEFPDMAGLSVRNLKYMRKFSAEYSESSIVQQPVAQLSWSHHIILMDKVKDTDKRNFYIQMTIDNGWSRNVLATQIDSENYERSGKAITNFRYQLSETQSELAQQITKDPYIFDFLSLSDQYHEKDLEDALTNHITKFLLELGAGFAFVGRQYHVEVGESDFYLDLLFYHLKLRSYVVIELKTGQFIPEYAGKLNFYLSVLDDTLRGRDDQPSIGLLICRDKDKVIAQYALKDINKPIGVSEYRITDSIPNNLRGKLPTIEELEKELEGRSRK